EKSAPVLTKLPEGGEEPFRQNTHPAASLYGFDQHRPDAYIRCVPNVRYPVDRCADMVERRWEGRKDYLWIQLLFDWGARLDSIAAFGKSSVGQPMVATFESQHTGAAGKEKGSLQCGFDGICAIQTEDHSAVLPWCYRSQAVEQPYFDVRRVHVSEPM